VVGRDPEFSENSESLDNDAGASVNSGSPEDEQEVPNSRHRAANNSGPASVLAAARSGGVGF